ncbi:MAG: hypothetical protein Q9225_003137 [Loekoesia sp. 1 TL-2023]
MAPQQTAGREDADFAKALQDLARGEQTASAMENQLTALERKIDDLLASAESQSTSEGNDQSKAQTADKSRMTEEK